MAIYTIELGKLIERGYHLNLDAYPIFDENYRIVLNQKIINHFWFREIGQETPDRFNFMLGRKMCEIMPYYNQLYKTQFFEFDPLETEYENSYNKGEESHTTKRFYDEGRKTGETTGDVFTSNRDNIAASKHVGHNDETIDNTYSKQGDRTIDVVGKTTEDLTENTTSHSTRTDNLQEQINENIQTNTLTTNDLADNTVTESEGTGQTKTSGTKTTTFSDIPQAGVTTTTTVSPDGSVTTETTGYATTITNENTNENSNSETTAKSTTNATHTGTVNVDGDSDRTMTTTNTGTQDNDGTGSKINDNTIDKTENTKELWHESGNSNDTSDYNETNDTNTTENEKIDSERNVARNELVNIDRKETEKNMQESKIKTHNRGRKGFSPSELVQKYRDIILNIDMQIINELDTLFMGVY